MSIKLSDTQLLMLNAAAQREDRCIAAPPNPKGAASQKVAAKLVAMGLAKEVKAGQRSHVWRRAVSAFRVWTCRRVGPISGGPLESRLAVERKRDAPAGGISTGSQRLSSAALRFARRKFDLLSAPIETGRKGPGLEPGSAVTRTGLSKTQGNSPRKRNFAPRDRRRVPPAACRKSQSLWDFLCTPGAQVPAIQADRNYFNINGLVGGAEGIRTPDLCSAIAALSHLSYSPVARLFTCASKPCQRRRGGGSRLLRGIGRVSKFRKNSCARSSTSSSTPSTFTSS